MLILQTMLLQLKRITFAFFALGLLWLNKAGAQPFGFEWIRPYMPYYKINIAQAGVYRLDSLYLNNAGLTLSGVNPNRLQLFRDGKEVPIYVEGASDGVLNNSDFIEFYAEPNDGSLDKDLYRTASEQPHTFRSQFSDTAIYFLTWLPDTSATQALRLNGFTASDFSNFLPEQEASITRFWAPMEEYYYGTFLPADQKYYLSDYGDGEGMMSSLIGLGQSRSYTFNTSGALPQNGLLEAKIIGASDFFLANPNAPNHHVRIYAQNELNVSVLVADTTFRGYGPRSITKLIPASVMANQLTVRAEVVNDLGVGSDYIGISYFQITYKKGNADAGSPEAFSQTATQVAARTLLQRSNFAGTLPIAYDFTNGLRSVGAKNGANAQVLLPYSSAARKLLFFSNNNTLLPVSIAQVSMQPISPLAYDYLIVSHKSLQASSEEYRQYRSKQYQVLLAYAEDLFNYYTFGYQHPLAIKKMARHLFMLQSKKPQYLLLLGRGYQNNLVRSKAENYTKNLVPAIGVPSSDNLFTNGFTGNNGAPSIATGRIPASTNEEVRAYLNKLISHETRSDSIASWRKDYLHLSGGSDAGEQTWFKNRLETYGNYIKPNPVGANIMPYYKTSNEPTESKLKQTLIEHQNKGLSMLTFYGHGSLTVLDMDFGGIQDLSETGRPAFYYFNGCNIGNANEEDPLGTGLVYGKDFICAPNKGAIGWLAHSNLTFTNQLELQMSLLYQRLSGAGYGATIGNNLKQILEASSAGNEPFARSHALQLLLQGDPAMVIYSPAQADYQIVNSDLFVTPANASVQSDSLAIGIILHNLAKANATDSVGIVIERTMPGNRTISYAPKWIAGPLNTDTFYYWINGLSADEIGSNRFVVKVNEPRKAIEINYNNNLAELNYFLPGSGVQALLPANFAIVPSDTVVLIAQNNNLFAKSVEYVFELDTSALFNSSGTWHRKSGAISASHLVQWPVIIPSIDSLTWYWRVKLNVPEAEGGIWDTRSFTYLKGHQPGWYQGSYHQLKQASQSRFLSFVDTLQQIQFSDNELVLGMENRRWDHRGMGVVIPYLLNEGAGNCMGQGVITLVFEPFQVDWPYELPNYPFNCAYVQANKNRQSNRYYIFNTNTAQGEQELRSLIDSVPAGYMVAMFSRYNSNIPSWDPATKSVFNKIGAIKLPGITSQNTAWAVIGRKGDALGSAAEDTVTNNGIYPNIPPEEQDPQDNMKLAIRRAFLLKWFEGEMITKPIGPAQAFGELSVKATDAEFGSTRTYFNYDVLVTSKAGQDSVWLKESTANKINLSNINAQVYPFVKIRFVFVDSTNRTPHVIDYARLSFVPSAELSLDPADSFYFHAMNLPAGDTLRLKVALRNLSSSPADSFLVNTLITDENRVVVWQSSQPLKLLATERQMLQVTAPTALMQGKHNLSLTVNESKIVQENTYTNNFLQQSFTVSRDKENPYLEVTFDGARIFNGDIVSPNPVIRMSNTDRNLFLLQQDTATFDVYLLRPGTFTEERIPHNHPDMKFYPATINDNKAVLEYTPKALKDGVYTLRVGSKDASGNPSGAADYKIDFNVISKSSITHFYPYPNPFTTQCRFVFTLTGSKVPDQFLLRILTVNGKVVREISKEEFGNVRIGNNISEFAWDGTDMFGDKLANGVYLYQVFTRIDGEEIENRETRNKDEGIHFTGNTGKIYLMR